MLSRKSSEQNRDYCERMVKIWRRFQISFFIVAVLCLSWLFLLPLIMNRPNMFLPATRDYMVWMLVIVAVLNLVSTEIVIRYFRKQMKEEKS